MAQVNGLKVVVTGVGGFVGGHIAGQLLAAGYSVCGTLRDLKRAGAVEAAIRKLDGATDGSLSFAAADLLSDAGWDAAFAGATYVIHAASPFPATVPKNEDDLIRPAREGTVRVLKAAKAAAVRRVVLTSSIAAINYGTGSAPYTESDWTDPEGPLATPYYKSKTLAERAAWAFARDNGLDLAVINPGLVLGPLLDRDPGTSVGIIQSLMTGRYPAMPDLRLPVVDVRDVADAHLRAMTVPEAAGERFIAAGAALSIQDIAGILRADFPAYSRKIPRLVLPNWLARTVAMFDPGLRLISGELGRDGRISNEKARRMLGWQPRLEAEAVRASARSLIEAHLV